MGTHREELYTPYGLSEAAGRIAQWLEAEGKGFKVVEKSANTVTLRHAMIMSPDIFFQLRLGEQSVTAECWVGGSVKYAISPKAVWGAISRRKGWEAFQSLKKTLTHDVEEGELR